MRVLAVSLAAAAALIAWTLLRARRSIIAAPSDAAAPDYDDSWSAPLLYPDVADPGVFGSLYFAVEDLVTDWQRRGEPYRVMIEAAAARHGVPGDLLMRVAYQESRFRDDIITGRTKSGAGAAGMFQFMPATARELGIDPLVPAQAADGAARYLASLRKMFGTWELALMAYNWGLGNVRKYLAGEKSPPTETRNYVAQIGADVALA